MRYLAVFHLLLLTTFSSFAADSTEVKGTLACATSVGGVFEEMVGSYAEAQKFLIFPNLDLLLTSGEEGEQLIEGACEMEEMNLRCAWDSGSFASYEVLINLEIESTHYDIYDQFDYYSYDGYVRKTLRFKKSIQCRIYPSELN